MHVRSRAPSSCCLDAGMEASHVSSSTGQVTRQASIMPAEADTTLAPAPCAGRRQQESHLSLNLKTSTLNPHMKSSRHCLCCQSSPSNWCKANNLAGTQATTPELPRKGLATSPPAWSAHSYAVQAAGHWPLHECSIHASFKS